VDQEQKPPERSFIRELVPAWQPTRNQKLWAVRGAIVLVVLLGVLTLIGLPFDITLWQWLNLLIVPAVIAAGGIWFNRQQRERELEIAAQQRTRDQEIEKQRAQDEALEAYLDQMSQLLLDKDRPLRRSKEGDEVRTLARARTLTVLPRLDSERKGSVVRFLYESGLITKDRRILDLSKAELSEASLWRATLNGANLNGAWLTQAYLIDADLREANLSEAALYRAHLNGANLSGANLSNAWLRQADLSGAKGVTGEQLAACKSLEGATMPNDQKYEDWLETPDGQDWLNKYKKGSGEDRENSGPS
jgi:uncharacterized protein YjbI with pentapeptide repeats